MLHKTTVGGGLSVVVGGPPVHTLVDLTKAFLEGLSVGPGEAVTGHWSAAVAPLSPFSWTASTEAEIKYSDHSSHLSYSTFNVIGV